MGTICMIGHPATGHINPTLPVIAELVRRGERVCYYATAPFARKIEQTGAIFRSLGDHALFERNLARGGLLGGMAGLMQTAEEIFPALLQDVRQDAPRALLMETHALWGNLLAQSLGLPVATLCAMFALNENLISTRALLDFLYLDPKSAQEGLLALDAYFETARKFDRRHGTRSPGVLGYIGNPQPLNIVLTSQEFQIGGAGFASSYQFVGSPGGIRLDGANTDAPFDATAIQSPLILIAMGTMYNNAIDFYKSCLAAFSDFPGQIVMSIGHRADPELLGPLPEKFVVRAYVPQLELLAKAELFITHGGINSAHEAMLQGVPMIVVPSAADHFIVARQVECMGAGVAISRSLATPEMLRSLANQVLNDPSYRESSARIGKTLQTGGGPMRAADLILMHFDNHSTSKEEPDVRISASA